MTEPIERIAPAYLFNTGSSGNAPAYRRCDDLIGIKCFPAECETISLQEGMSRSPNVRKEAVHG